MANRYPRNRKSRDYPPLLDRFMAKVSPEPNSGCWLWDGSLNRNGYGQFRQGGGKELTTAQRAAYQLLIGQIPTGIQVLHKCDVPCCVNPQHLFLGTIQDNMADRNAKKRHAHGERMGSAKLTEADVLSIRASTESNKILAARYGRGIATIQHARSGRYWKHL